MIMSASRKQKPGRRGVQSRGRKVGPRADDLACLGTRDGDSKGVSTGCAGIWSAGVGESLEVIVGFPGRTGDWEASGVGSHLEG